MAAAAVNAGLLGPVQDGGGAHQVEAEDDEIGELLDNNDGIIDIQDGLPQGPPQHNIIELVGDEENEINGADDGKDQGADLPHEDQGADPRAGSRGRSKS